MNLRRGFFRLWLVLSALFVIATAVVSFPGVKSEFEKAELDWIISKEDTLLVPVACSEARGKSGDDYNVVKYLDGRDRCWYEFPRFRGLYPEYTDLTDNQLSDRLYKNAGIPATPSASASPWTLVLKAFGVAIGAPLIVLAVGSALGWSFAGFSGERKSTG